MARVSTSSTSSNGHLPAPANAQGTPTTRLVTDTAKPTTSTSSSSDEGASPTRFNFSDPRYAASTQPVPYDPSLLPRGSRSLSSIGLQAFWLGFTLSACLLLTTHLILHRNTAWRLPAFFACLSLFHFLEYYTTARYNLPAVRASSFLLFNNGTAYNIAHSVATLEIIVSLFMPSYQRFLVSSWSIAVGLVLVVLGQTVRSVAMAQAGTNFNHTPQKTRREGHELVTGGVYGYLRHPSYFGFFWWALGTQVLVGNKVCLVGYAVALWKFFRDRIVAEERTLVEFFGSDYEDFRRRTRTGIPFIR